MSNEQVPIMTCSMVSEKPRAGGKRHLVQACREVLSVFTCAKLVKICGELVTTDVAGIRGEAGRFEVVHKSCPMQIVK